MALSIKQYQFKALEAIKARLRICFKELMESGVNSSLVFQAPTGSGKTYIISRLLEDLAQEFEKENYCVIWSCPGTGSLHLQSYNAVSNYLNGFPTCTLLEEEFLGSRTFIRNKEVVFINWEKVIQKDKESDKWINNLMKDKEGMSFIDVLDTTRFKNDTKIILIIDESHIGDSQKTRIKEFKETIIKPDIVLEMSATPLAERVDVMIPIDEVIDEGMIKSDLIVNKGISEDDKKLKESESETLVLEKGYEMREKLAHEYALVGENVNPLCLIQIPNAKAGDVKKEVIREFLRSKGITEQNNKLRFWCDDYDEFDKEAIKISNDPTEFLVFKTAIATGWDCPRAHVLIKFRDGKSETFETQTVGRIMRTAKAHSYDNDLLDNAYIYTNLYNFGTSHDTYHPNKIKTEYSEMRGDYNMDIIHHQTMLKSYYRSRQGDYNSADSRYSNYFIEEFVKFFEIEKEYIDAPIKDTSYMEAKFKEKGVDIDIFTEDKIISETEVDIDKADKGNVFDTSENLVSIKMSNADIEANYYSIIKENLNGLAPVRSKDAISPAIMNCFGIFYNVYPRSERVLNIQKLIVKNKDKFSRIIFDSTEKFRDMLVNTRVGKIGINYDFKISKVTSYSLETHVQSASIRSLYQPFYIAKRGNGHGGIDMLEKEFIDLLDSEECVEWFWENGIGDTRTNFGIGYNNGMDIFRPDFIVKFRNGDVGIFDTKPIDYNVQDTKDKAEALYEYLEKTNSFRGHNPKVIGGIVVKKGEHFFFYCQKVYHDYDEDNSKWIHFEDLIRKIEEDIKVKKANKKN